MALLKLFGSRLFRIFVGVALSTGLVVSGLNWLREDARRDAIAEIHARSDRAKIQFVEQDRRRDAQVDSSGIGDMPSRWLRNTP